jgi:site-specific DNA-methyltransferase (adenine-specific)
VLTFSNRNGKTVHPTQKPVDLLKYLIKTYTNEGMTVLDNTMGSGSTGVAAKQLNRNFIGIELDEKYFEIAKQRINKA